MSCLSRLKFYNVFYSRYYLHSDENLINLIVQSNLNCLINFMRLLRKIVWMCSHFIYTFKLLFDYFHVIFPKLKNIKEMFTLIPCQLYICMLYTQLNVLNLFIIDKRGYKFLMLALIVFTSYCLVSSS